MVRRRHNTRSYNNQNITVTKSTRGLRISRHKPRTNQRKCHNGTTNGLARRRTHIVSLTTVRRDTRQGQQSSPTTNARHRHCRHRRQININRHNCSFFKLRLNRSRSRDRSSRRRNSRQAPKRSNGHRQLNKFNNLLVGCNVSIISRFLRRLLIPYSRYTYKKKGHSFLSRQNRHNRHHITPEFANDHSYEFRTSRHNRRHGRLSLIGHNVNQTKDIITVRPTNSGHDTVFGPDRHVEHSTPIHVSATVHRERVSRVYCNIHLNRHIRVNKRLSNIHVRRRGHKLIHVNSTMKNKHERFSVIRTRRRNGIVLGNITRKAVTSGKRTNGACPVPRLLRVTSNVNLHISSKGSRPTIVQNLRVMST